MTQSEDIAVPGIEIRLATRSDLPGLTEIYYYYYVVHTPITFDVRPWTVAQRIPWFEQFESYRGRLRLVQPRFRRIARALWIQPDRSLHSN